MTTELLSAEQLDLVSGGTHHEDDTDKNFFRKIGINTKGVDIEDIFAANGVKFDANVFTKNDYSIKINGEWCRHPHLAALGYVLKQRNYPGFSGEWTNLGYVKYFIEHNLQVYDHFH